MYHFNPVRLFAAALFILVSGCAGNSVKQPQDIASEADGQSAEANSTISAPNAALAALPDPMRKDLPLALIKGYDQVQQLQKAKNQAGAVQSLQNLQLNFPKYSGPSYRLARLYLDAGQYDKALAAINQGLTINPKNYYAHNLKGIILREQGQFGQAQKAYQDALAIFPAHPQSHLNMGILADIYLYDLPLALVHYEQYLALQSQPDKKVSGWVMDLKRRMPKDAGAQQNGQK